MRGIGTVTHLSSVRCLQNGASTVAEDGLEKPAAPSVETDLVTAENRDSYPYKPPAADQVASGGLPNPFQSWLEAEPWIQPVPSADQMTSDQVTDVEPSAPVGLVQASVIDLDDIQVCKRETGEDWLLGRGSYGAVSPAPCFLFFPSLVPHR